MQVLLMVYPVYICNIVTDVETMSSEDEDAAPMVMVGGKNIPVTLVDNTIISKMTASEKEAYITTYQEYFSNLYD